MNTDKLHVHSRIDIGIALLLFLFTALYISTAYAEPDVNNTVSGFIDTQHVDGLSETGSHIAYLVLAKNEEREERNKENEKKKHRKEKEEELVKREREKKKRKKKKEKEHDDDDDDDDEIPPAVSDNIIAAHDRNSPRYNRNCSECHADIRTRESLNPNIPDAHVAMLPFAPGETDDDKQCTWCHRSVDLVQAAASPKDTGSSLRKLVDVRLCTMCHGPGGTGKQFYQTTLEQLGPDGVDLYDLTCSGCHRVLENSEVRGESANEIHEAINENEGGMAPLSALTDAQIQAIANALAQ